MSRRTSRNNSYTSGISPSGFYIADVVAVDGGYVSVKVPRLGLNNIYENVPFTGFTPSVGDRIWVSFVEGKASHLLGFVGAGDTGTDITEIIAGLGLSGGGSSGSITVDFEPSELTTATLAYEDKVVISDASDGGEPKLVPISEVITTANGDGGEPIGHEDKSESVISFDYSTRTFTIAPVGDSYVVWCAGQKFVKTDSESVVIGSSSDLYYISFDADGVLQATTTFYQWDSETPTAYIHYNSGEPAKYMLFDERHGIVLDWQTHEYLHRTRGAAIANGFDASNFDVSTQNGSTDDQAYIDIASGTFFDEDLQVDIVHSNTPTANTWEQDLQGPAQIPVFYHSGTTGWTYDAPTNFPLKYGGTPRPTYNLNSGGTWSTPEITSNNYGISWIVATNQLNYPVIAIMGQDFYTNLGDAEAVTWDSMNLDDLPVVELRVLYKVIYRAAGSNTPGAYFAEVDDYRRALSSATSTAAAVVDHGNLTGLGDDDHTQYLLVDGSRAAVELTVTGDLAVDTDTLFVDASTDRVGIGTASPAAKLDVAGDIYFNNNALVVSDAGTSNIDHIWHDETNNAWNFVSDSTYKAAGNSALNAATLNVTTINLDTSVHLTNVDADGSMRVQGDNGYIDIGPKNSTYCHIYTDRGSFYFNKSTLYANSTDNVIWHAGNDGSGSGLDADLLDGSHASAFATSGHNHTYNVNDAWLRDNGDNANVKLYGNSRQMVFRTDGTSQYASGVGGYPFVWMYGGDASSNRRMILNTSGQLWLSNYGWLHDYFSASTHSHSYLSTSGGTISGNLTVTGAIYGASGNGDYVLKVGDDAWIGDTDAANTIAFFGNSNDDRCTLQFGRVSGASISGASSTIDINNRLFVPNLLTTTGNNTLRYDGNSSEMLKFTSLREKKEDINSIRGMLDYLNEESPLQLLNPVIFHEKDQTLETGEAYNSTRGEYVYGFIAEEVHEVIPESTFTDSEGNLVSFSNDSIVALLVAEVQRLTGLVHELYAGENPDWVAPHARPAERSDLEKAIYDAKAAELAAAAAASESQE